MTQTSANLVDAFRTILRTRPAWLATNVRSWSVTAIARDRPETSPFTGKLVHVDKTLAIIKLSPKTYSVIDAGLLQGAAAAIVGQTVHVAGYERLSLEDFQPVSMPRDSGNGSMTVLLFANTQLPTPPDSSIGAYLREAVERTRMPDGARTIANALADNRATDIAWSCDPADRSCRLAMTVNGGRFQGELTLALDPANLSFSVLLATADGTSAIKADSLKIEGVASLLGETFGDGETYCQVTLTPATGTRRAAA
jgi:hypothetical protein